jgi:uncharacterized protein YqkB
MTLEQKPNAINQVDGLGEAAELADKDVEGCAGDKRGISALYSVFRESAFPSSAESEIGGPNWSNRAAPARARRNPRRLL